MPVVVAVVLASEGRFGAPGTSPPAPTSTVAALGTTPAATPAAAGQLRPGATAAPTPATAAQPTSPQSGAATTAPQAARPTAATGPTPVPRIPNSGAGLFRAYAVQPGDTVKFVADMFGVSPASVAQASGLKNADQLRVGQVLTVPIQPGWLYRVQSGETLDQIAARTGIPSDVILSASKLTTDSVGPGDVILIPDQTTARGK
ncbi:MAG TPA: LysM peptidoglycan-binding domain-containing protein [Chloroflexota bacterium]|nr:LysM peptidoglycan-binding domain-containing protein [Chloroflexota bacterium]